MAVEPEPVGAIGVVLCGGASRRMGTDKATLPVGGVAMAVRVARALAAVPVDEVLAVGGGPSVRAVLAGQEVRHVTDRWPGQGPLGAIVAALDLAGGRRVLVVPCDLLDPSPTAMARCLEALDQSGADVAVPSWHGRRQWVHAAWSPSALGVLSASFEGGERAVHRAAQGLRLCPVDGIEPGALADADGPDDLPGGTGATHPADAAGRPVRRDAALGRHRYPGDMEIPEIDVAELARHMAGGAPLVDVREDDEYAEAHVPGARHLPLAQVPARLDEVPSGDTVYVICRSGGRSAKAVEHLRSAGIDAVNVAGGTLAWIEAGQPVAAGTEPG